MKVSAVFFFFQAEDGIRDTSVTGVQTCALPISAPGRHPARHAGDRAAWPAPTEEAAGRGSPNDPVDLWPRRSAQGPRVHDRGDARDRRAPPECPLFDRRTDAPGAPEEGRRAVSK